MTGASTEKQSTYQKRGKGIEKGANALRESLIEEKETGSHPAACFTSVAEEKTLRFNAVSPPFIHLWRRYSDQFAFEGVQFADQKQGSVGFSATFEESVSEDDTPVQGRFSEKDRGPSESSRIFSFEDAFSDKALGSSLDSSTTLYLDPDLVKRSRTNTSTSARHISVPKTIETRCRRSRQVEIDGNKKQVMQGLIELKPGEFVRVHGKEHAQNAIEMGQSTIVKCSSCNTKYRVDSKAGALYCTQCNTVTRLGKDEKTVKHHGKRRDKCRNV
jgi:hypothetical protein